MSERGGGEGEGGNDGVMSGRNLFEAAQRREAIASLAHNLSPW